MIKDTRRNVVTMNEKEYYNLIKPYEDAMQMILSRLDTLNHTLYESSATHLVPIHNIQSRIKSKKSIEVYNDFNAFFDIINYIFNRRRGHFRCI